MKHIHILCSKKVMDVPLIIDSPVVRQHYKITRGPDVKGVPWLVHCETGLFDIDKYIDAYNCSVFVGGNFWEEFDRGSDRLIRIESILKKCKVIFCISKYMHDVVLSEIKMNNVLYLPGGMWGLDHLAYKVNLARFTKKQDYIINGSPVVSLCMSLSFEEKYKGLILFLRTVKDIATRYGVKYVCYGRAKGQYRLIDKIRKAYPDFTYHHWNRIGETYDFTKGFGDLLWPQALCNSDIYVHPSFLDTWGCAIADAMCAGVPAMVFNVKGCREVGDTYIKCNHKRLDIIRAVFEKLLTDTGYRQSIGDAMHAEAVDRMERHRYDFLNLLNGLD